MSTTNADPELNHLIDPLADCLTPEAARRVLALKADGKLQARVDSLADRHSQGQLTPEELVEYTSYVNFSTFVAILKSKTRQRLAHESDER